MSHVLSWLSLCCYVMSGTDTAYRAEIRCVMSGTDVALLVAADAPDGTDTAYGECGSGELH